MARLPQLIEIAKKHDLKIITIQDLIAYRMERERLIERMASYKISSKFGDWEVIPFRQLISDDIHLALVKGKPEQQPSSLVRVYSMSRTGELLGLIFGNTGNEIDRALSMISQEGNGVFLLMRHNEESDNILDVLNSFTVKAKTGSGAEQRDIGVGAQILRDLGINKMKLISNHEVQRIGLIGFGLEIVENVRM
jgi:3,4-dihydroxy 2-butanone 4-phosphate synthase/GTP cyclohydrolase II